MKTVFSKVRTSLCLMMSYAARHWECKRTACRLVSGRGSGGRASETRRSDPGGERRESAGSDTRTGRCHPEKTERNGHTGCPVITHACSHTCTHTHTELLVRRTRSDSWTTTLIVTLNPNTQKIDKRNGVRHAHTDAHFLCTGWWVTLTLRPSLHFKQSFSTSGSGRHIGSQLLCSCLLFGSKVNFPRCDSDLPFRCFCFHAVIFNP